MYTSDLLPWVRDYGKPIKEKRKYSQNTTQEALPSLTPSYCMGWGEVRGVPEAPVCRETRRVPMTPERPTSWGGSPTPDTPSLPPLATRCRIGVFCFPASLPGGIFPFS